MSWANCTFMHEKISNCLVFFRLDWTLLCIFLDTLGLRHFEKPVGRAYFAAAKAEMELWESLYRC